MQKTNMSRPQFRTEPLPAEEETIVHGILGIAKLLSLEFRQIAADNHLSDCLAGTLWHVHRSGQIKAGDLARTMSCDMGNLSGALDRLEALGLVERVISGADRRVRLMQLTAKGRKVAAHIEQSFSESTIHHELGKIDPKERYALSNALSKIHAALSATASKNANAPTSQVRRLPA